MAIQHATLHFSRFDSSNVTIINDTNPVGQDTTNDQIYAQILCDDMGGSESYGFWQLDGSNIPSNAYNISITNAQARCAVIGINNPNDVETCVQLYENINTPKGDPSNNPFPMDPQGGNVSIDNPGTWTLSQIRTFYMKVWGQNHGGFPGVEIYVFGVDVEVEYETPTPSPDYEIGSGAWYANINQGQDVGWKKVYKMYYKVGGSWKEVAYAYRKQDNTWYTIGQSKLLFSADFTSNLSYTSYIDGGTTGVFTVNTGFTPSYDADGLLFPANSSNFRIGTVIPTALNTFLHTANQEVWFTMRATVIRDAAGSTSYSSGCDYGWGNNINSPCYRQDSVHNFFSINGEYYKNRSGEPYVPAGTTVWLKTCYGSNGYFTEYVYSNSTWTGANAYSNPGTWKQHYQNTSSSKAIWNYPNHRTMGLHHGLQEIKVRNFKIWRSEPTDAEIGI